MVGNAFWIIGPYTEDRNYTREKMIIFNDHMQIYVFVFRLCYVQSLAGHKSPVTAVSASETTGDIATVCDSGE